MEDNKLRIEASLDMEEEMRKVDRSAGRLLFSAQMIQHPKYTTDQEYDRRYSLSLLLSPYVCVDWTDGTLWVVQYIYWKSRMTG